MTLRKDLATAIAAGHPWIYDRAIAREPTGAGPGSVVEVVLGGKVLAVGYYDPSSPLRFRLLGSEVGPYATGGWARRTAAASITNDPDRFLRIRPRSGDLA